MSKKSKKILAYLMFVAALCGTPAVSEARGGSGGQVETEKASASQRGGSLGQSFISYFIDKHGWEALKLLGAGGVSFETAKLLKIGDWDALAKYVLGIKSADLKKAKDLMDQYGVQKEAFDKEKKDFSNQRAKALQENEKLVNDKDALEIKNLTLSREISEKSKVIEDLKNSNKNLSDELTNTRDYNSQLVNLNNEENEKIDALLSDFLPVRMSGELNIFGDNSWKQESYSNDNINKVVVEPYSGKGGVQVVIMKYDGEGNVLGQQPEWLTLPADGFFNAIAEQANGNLVNISLKDIGLGYCGITRLARYSYAVGDEIVAAYFPVKGFQEVNNVENNENNENNNNENVENNENNNENIQNNEMNANENNNINGENNENNEGNDN